MIDSVYVSKEYRTKLAEILFEDMKVNSVIFMNSSTLTLFSSGETTYLLFFFLLFLEVLWLSQDMGSPLCVPFMKGTPNITLCCTRR